MHLPRLTLLSLTAASIFSSSALSRTRASGLALIRPQLVKQHRVPSSSSSGAAAPASAGCGSQCDLHKLHQGHFSSGPIPMQEADGLPCVNIRIGNPPSDPVLVALDTASPLTWIGSGKYTPRLSTTARDTGYKFNDTYVSGDSVVGEIYNDTLRLGRLELRNQSFGYATSRNNADRKWEGIIGLDLPSSLDAGDGCSNCTLMTNLINLGVISQDLFAFDAASNAPAFYLGSNPGEEADQPIQYFDVPRDSYKWRIPSSAINHFDTGSIVLDTGSAVIVTAKTRLEDICRSVDGFIWAEEPDLFTCNVTGVHRPLSVTLGNLSVSLRPETVYAHTTLLVYALEGVDDLGILGLPFFKNAYVGFYGSQTNQSRIGITSLHGSQRRAADLTGSLKGGS